MDKVGLAPVTYKSGKFKDMLSGERSTNEIPAEERAMVQGLIDETYAKFTNVVCDGPQPGAQAKPKGRQSARQRLGKLCRWPGAVRHTGAQIRLRG